MHLAKKIYAEIYDLIAANNCQMELAVTYIVLLSNITVMLYKADLLKGVEDTHIKFTLSSGIYSIYSILYSILIPKIFFL